MTKSLLISIQPQHLLNILNGDKTYEVRKVVPQWVIKKLDRGETVEAYLYCTKGKPYLYYGDLTQQYEIDDYKNKWGDEFNGTIPVKVAIDRYRKDENEHLLWLNDDNSSILNVKSCTTRKELIEYANGKDLYALHISKGEILEEVMKLGDFYNHSDSYEQCPFAMSLAEEYMTQEEMLINRGSKKLTKAPQSFMTVWVK